MDNLQELLPPMLFGEELKKRMTTLPGYDESVRQLEPGARLLKLMDIYKVFVPQTMAQEIYHKLYMMTVMSLNQKGTVGAVRQANENFRWADGQEYHGIITGASSATVIGTSGIGKTSCVQKALEMMGPVLETEKPYRKIIPAVIVSCPFDSNYKGLLCQILVSIDEALGTDYYRKSQRAVYSAQQILAMVCQLCQLHIGVLIIDEIQFLVQHRSGTQLYRMILQLINAAGISVMLIGTQECIDYFTQAPQMARRMTGLQYSNLPYGSEFSELANTLFRLQYVKEKTDITEGIQLWLFEHTAGNPANLMALIHDAQEIAIIRGTEKMDISALTEAYSNRMKMLHQYIEPCRAKVPKAGKRAERKTELPEQEAVFKESIPVEQIASEARNSGMDACSEYGGYFAVEEVAV